MPTREPRLHSREIFTADTSGIPTTSADTAAVDAFGRSRISEPLSLFDSSFEYDLQPLFWDTSLSGGADITHDSDKHVAVLTVSGSTAGTAILQTFAYHPYQNGKSQRIIPTFVLGAPATGITRRVGYFDASDGIFVEQTSAGLSLVLRSSASGGVVNTTIAQTNWNKDTLDGNGVSEITLDQTKRQILDMDMGVGRIRYGFNIDGKTVYAHYINNAPALAVSPYMRTGTLPVRYEIINDGTGSASEFIAVCAAVFGEGGFEATRALPFTATRGTVGASVASRVPVLSIRPKATFNSLENRSQITPLGVDILTISQSILVDVVYGALLFGTGSFVSADDNSAVEFNNSFTAISGGFPVQSFYVSTTGIGVNPRGTGARPILSRLPLTLDIDGANPIPLSIVCTPLSGTATVYASINWDEIR